MSAHFEINITNTDMEIDMNGINMINANLQSVKKGSNLKKRIVTALFSLILATTGLMGFSHVAMAAADNDPVPTINLALPANNSVSIYPATIPVEASVSFPGNANGNNDQREGVEVEFLVNGVEFAEAEHAPYQVSFTPTAAGVYTLTAQIHFGEGKRVILSDPVTVISDLPPTVSLISPTSDIDLYEPATLTLSADASAPIGTIVQVDFYASKTDSSGATTNVLVGTATTAPYTLTWSNVTAGTYSLTAVATDNYGIVNTSAGVKITVKPDLQVYYIHSDQLDTPREITNTNNVVVWQWDNSDPFGNNAANENPNGKGVFAFPLRFPGQYYDADTGLHYNYFRDYDPSTGRYVQSDPIGLAGGMNTYGYVGGNPVNVTDVYGLCGFGDCAIPAIALCLSDPACFATVTYAVCRLTGNCKVPNAMMNEDGNNNDQPQSCPVDGKGDKDPSTPTGQRGNPLDVEPGTNSPTTIGDRDYTGHSLDRMQGRGVPPSAVEDAINNGQSSPGNQPGTTVHEGQNGVTVVTGQNGQVITVIAK